MTTSTLIRIRRSICAGVLIAGASVPAAAQARPIYDEPSSIESSVLSTQIADAGPSAQAGFEWGDAGIGAAATIVLLGTGAAATGAARRRRGHGTVAG